jgi:hypothetical protein
MIQVVSTEARTFAISVKPQRSISGGPMGFDEMLRRTCMRTAWGSHEFCGIGDRGSWRFISTRIADCYQSLDLFFLAQLSWPSWIEIAQMSDNLQFCDTIKQSEDLQFNPPFGGSPIQSFSFCRSETKAQCRIRPSEGTIQSSTPFLSVSIPFTALRTTS